MSVHSHDAATDMEAAARPLPPFPVEREYERCIAALQGGSILTVLSGSNRLGVLGLDGNEYPVPSEEEVEAIFVHNRELVAAKRLQGFGRLELTPLAMPTRLLLERMKAAIIRHASEGKIYQTRRSPDDPALSVTVNADRQVWVWDTLLQRLDTDDLVYFPRLYASDPHGRTKLEAATDARICGAPGWSVGLIEGLSVLPQQGQAKTLGGRPQLEIGASPRDYLQTLRTPPYHGETGETIEDFAVRFITRLEETNEISNDRYDDNAAWLLGQYLKYEERVQSDLVPTGWWHRALGRARLDAHRPGNRLCTRSWGAATTVRLGRP